MIGLTCLTINGKPLVAPKLNRRRAVFVLSKIDEILSWEKATDREGDSKFVELGRYLCEVRASASSAAAPVGGNIDACRFFEHDYNDLAR